MREGMFEKTKKLKRIDIECENLYFEDNVFYDMGLEYVRVKSEFMSVEDLRSCTYGLLFFQGTTPAVSMIRFWIPSRRP